MALVGEYSVHKIDLTTAGQQTVYQAGDYLLLSDARDVGGSQYLATFLEVAFGRERSDFMPLYINSKVRGRFDQFTVRWAAQSGVSAFLYIARAVEEGGLALDIPPARQIVSSAIGTLVSVAAVTVTTTATLLAAANPTRQKLMLLNNSSNYVYVGPSTVSTTDGIFLAPGNVMTIDGTTAAIYGRMSAGTANVRVWEES